MSDDAKIRLDKWLWAARFFKTRALAKSAIEGGKVHYQGVRAKVSKNVELSAHITLRQGLEEKIIVVKALSDQRKGAPEAQLLYEETQASIAKRESNAQLRKAQGGQLLSDRRPTKKERRQIIQIKHQDIE